MAQRLDPTDTRSLGIQLTPSEQEQADARDAALALLNKTRKALIETGLVTAIQISTETGSVTSAQMMKRMRRFRETAARMDEVDGRWTGAVFGRKGWKSIGLDKSGSHRRLSRVWTWVGVRNVD